MTHRHFAPVLPALLLLGACATATELDEEAAAIGDELELELGGFDMEDEAPMFGLEEDFAALDLVEAAPEYVDPMAETAEVAAMRSAPDAVAYRIHLEWGLFPGDPDATAPHDWSGLFHVSRGVMIVERAVRFDGPIDRVLGRPDPRTVAFRSMTLPHHDGMLLTVLDPTPEAAEPLVLTYVADLPGPLGAEGGRHSVPVRTLLDGPRVLGPDVDGHRMIAAALARPVDVCAQGFLHGRWHRVAEGRGRFIGRVVGEDGDVRGHVRGIYGERASGEQVFFGKYVNTDGALAGIFRGGYGDGRFEGRWLHRSGEVGALGGRYREEIPGPETGGHFIGRWTETSCDVRR